MKYTTRMLATGGALALILSHSFIAGAADGPAPAMHVRGTLTKVSATDLVVSTASGPMTLKIDAKTKVVGVVAATAAEITSGAFIGTANVPGETSTSTRALEVVVFPESMAGTGEGDYAWDLPAGKTHASMTNGTVAARHGSMMTNATVTGVNNGSSKTVTLQYKGGSKKVTIPPGTPIVRATPGTPSLLVAGAHIVAVKAPASGAIPFVIVGEDGVVPPM